MADRNTARGMNKEELARFRARVEGLGASFDEAMNTNISTAGAKAPVVLSMDLDRTVLPPRVIVVTDIATMKDQGGVSDSTYASGGLTDQAIKYPPPWDHRLDKQIDEATSREDLAARLGTKVRANVRTAMDAWLLGNSRKVRDYERVINALHFPVYAAAWTLKSICVAAGTTLVLTPPPGTNPPTLIVSGEVCIEQGGQIQSLVPVSVEVYGQMSIVDAGGCTCPPGPVNRA